MSLNSTTNSLIHGNKSVSNPSAQITKVLQAGTNIDTGSAGLEYVINSNKNVLGNYYYVFMIQVRSGCRISEALSISPEDISSNGSVLIRAKKSGHDRVVFVNEASCYLLKCKRNNITPFKGFNRFQAYRHLKKLGIGFLKAGRKNASITHVFRDSFVRDVRTLDTDTATISRTIGHKSQKSTEFYGKD